MGGKLGRRSSSEPPPAFLRIAERGFDAVPALIAHLGDDRITHTVRVGFDNFPTYAARLGEIASDLLQGIAADDLGKDWLRRQQGWQVERDAALAWWAKAKATGEEAYLTAHALPPAPDARFPNRLALLVLARRHPARLEEVYRAARGRKGMDTNTIAQDVASSALPDAEKRRILEAAARTKDIDHVFAALRALRALDATAYARILVGALDALPSTPTEPYWRAPESAASRMAAETADPRVWAALAAAARRVDVGLRLELVHTLCYTYLEQRQRRERLAFLAGFLDDASVPDLTKDPKLWEGPRAGFTFPPLAVRDVTAMTIAAILEMPDHPREEWTRAQWDALLAEVKRRLEIAGSPR
jgi:hypothetical protein